MLKIIKKSNARQAEEDKKEEEVKGDPNKKPTKKRCPGEIRMTKEIAELDLPTHAKVTFPDDNDIMKFEVSVDLTKEECLWKGGKYKFTVQVSANYPHEAPKAHCDT